MTPVAELKMTVPLEVGIGCRDLAAMRRFYEHTLGLRVVSESHVPAEIARSYRLADGPVVVLRMQTPYGERIKLVAPERAPELPPSQPANVFDRPNVMYLTFIIADIHDAARRVLAGGGVAMSGETPIQGRPGLYVLFLRDPEGNVLELVQYDDPAAYRPDLQRS